MNTTKYELGKPTTESKALRPLKGMGGVRRVRLQPPFTGLGGPLLY